VFTVATIDRHVGDVNGKIAGIDGMKGVCERQTREIACGELFCMQIEEKRSRV